MARFLKNPTFDIETGNLLSHDGESFEEPVFLFDRSLAKAAGNEKKTADVATGGFQGSATNELAGVLPGLLKDANNPTGYTPEEVNNMLTMSGQAAGGANAGLLGQADLTAARTRNSGGFSAALDEAARQKSKALSNVGLQVSANNANLKQEKQQEARKGLEGLYGVDTSNMLKSMGLSNQDLQTQLEAKKQGWLQNTLNTITALTKGAQAGTDAAKTGQDAGWWG